MKDSVISRPAPAPSAGPAVLLTCLTTGAPGRFLPVPAVLARRPLQSVYLIRPGWDVLIKQIEAFVEVVRRGTVSRAAEALGVTQPALTARLHALERELGQAVFARSGRGVRLTDAVRVFLPHAERALLAIADGRASIADLASGRAGKL